MDLHTLEILIRRYGDRCESLGYFGDDSRGEPWYLEAKDRRDEAYTELKKTLQELLVFSMAK